MGLKAVLDSLDGLSDEIKALYVEREADGKFVLQVDDIKQHPEASGLRNALDVEKREKAQAKKKVAELEARLAKFPEDFDPEEHEELKRLKERLADEDDDDGDPSKKKRDKSEKLQLSQLHEQRIANINKRHAQELDRERQRYERLRAKMRRSLIEQALTEAFVEGGVRPELMDAAKAMIGRRADVEMEDDDDDDPVVIIKTADQGNVPIAKFAPDWLASDQGKVFLAPAKGGGADGSDARKRAEQKDKGVNPWKDETYNLTEQSRIHKTNPELAKKMAREANKPLHPGAPMPAA